MSDRVDSFVRQLAHTAMHRREALTTGSALGIGVLAALLLNEPANANIKKCMRHQKQCKRRCRRKHDGGDCWYCDLTICI
jgi:hypothetical protein